MIWGITVVMSILATACATSINPLETRAVAERSSIPIHITNNKTFPIPRTLFGYMWEDINHSGDGGLYAELVKNRAFQKVVPDTIESLDGWNAYNGATISVTNSTAGVSTVLPNSLQFDAPMKSTGAVGFENTGYWGMKISAGQDYTGSFYAKSSSFMGKVTVQLVSATTGEIYASKDIDGIQSSWSDFTYRLTPSASASDTNNVLRFTVDENSTNSTIYFGLFSLFPPTWKGRKNGLRIDLAEALAATQPGVFRFPGGNNLEVNTPHLQLSGLNGILNDAPKGTATENRWKWNETIGPLEDRPGRMANWGYINTDGLGLMEYLDFTEDLGAIPILGIWAGLSIGDYADPENTFPTVPATELQPYINDAINQLNFITGDADTNPHAALRAKYGRHSPYELKYLEIGNEDNFGSISYKAYRWRMFVEGIEAAFPGKFQFIATTLPATVLTPAYKQVDYHVYSTPEWFLQNAHMLDNYPRDGTQWFVGEYAVTATNSSCLFGPISCGRLNYPTIQGSVAEAAFMTMFERNSDVVFASAYAPTLQHVIGTQWTPDLISFDAGKIVLSTSYYTQKMFSLNRGTHQLETVPSSSKSNSPLFWSVTHNSDHEVVYVKMVNAGTTDLDVSFSLEFPITNSYIATTLSGPNANSSNRPEDPNVVVPQEKTYTLLNTSSLNHTFIAQSISILALPAGGW